MRSINAIPIICDSIQQKRVFGATYTSISDISLKNGKNATLYAENLVINT